jgi:hypothetical protein
MARKEKEAQLSARELRKLLDYEPATGLFRWRVKRRGRPYGWMPVGTVAGSIWPTGYRIICINYVRYKAARLAFLWMTGRWPSAFVDHINRDESDDRWENLRPVSISQNAANSWRGTTNALGLKGVCYEADRNKYKAYIEFGGRSIHLGRFKTAEEASVAYAAAAKKYFGAYARTKE